jgi:hypothetical protein
MAMKAVKQDRTGSRTPSDLERKWDFERVKETAEGAAKKLTPVEIFNILTDNGKQQGLYRDKDGNVYINASYIKSGELLADLIKSGRVTSEDGKAYFDLDLGFFAIDEKDDTGMTKGMRLRDSALYGILFDENTVREAISLYFSGEKSCISDGRLLPSGFPMHIWSTGGLSVGKPEYPLQILGKTVSWKDNGDGTYTLIGV